MIAETRACDRRRGARASMGGLAALRKKGGACWGYTRGGDPRRRAGRRHAGWREAGVECVFVGGQGDDETGAARRQTRRDKVACA